MDIEKTVDSYVDLMGEALDRFDVSNDKQYAQFCAQTYYYVCHSTPFLAFAAGLMKPHDQKYFKRFIEHISEEDSHEILALNDLKRLGYNLEDFPQMAETRMLWEPQYYKILHLDPLALIGYIIPLELMSAKHFPRFLDKLNNAFGKKTTSFVKVHAEEDQDHIKEAMAILKDLSPERQEIVMTNVEQTAIGYSHWLDALKQDLTAPFLGHLAKTTPVQQHLSQ